MGDIYDEDQHSDTLDWAIHGSFNTKLHADVSIRLGDIELPAHGIVLASQSEYFKKALQSSMKEGIEKKFEFSEGSMHAHWRMFEYIYRGRYCHDAEPLLGSIDLLKDIRVYQLADYFQIPNLKNYAMRSLKLRLKKLYVSENFVGCIREVYGMSIEVSHDMRKEISDIARTHLTELWDKKSFRALLREGGDFVMDILKVVAADGYQ
ncbi:hypothetical protein TrVGV298_008348 [Trichoderma virens]|nr:hypothetical protein TrVGV298_008348 [Trichoderma virens]